MTPRVLLLDLDDTILSYSGVADELWHELAAEHAPALGVGADALANQLDTSRNWYWTHPVLSDEGRLDMRGARRRIVQHAFEALALTAPAVGQQIADRFTDTREARVEAFPGAVDKLAQWRAAGVPLALCTNGHPDFQRAKIERFDLEQYFAAIFVEGELGFGKPDPRVFRGALEALGAQAEEAWMIGDNLYRDVHGAQEVGIHGVWVDHRGRGLPDDPIATPDRIVTAIAEIELGA